MSEKPGSERVKPEDVEKVRPGSPGEPPGSRAAQGEPPPKTIPAEGGDKPKQKPESRKRKP